MSTYRFSVGDRVQRQVNVYNSQSRLRRGTVVDRYSYRSMCCGDYPELYAVEWDGDGVTSGYLPHGLQPLAVDGGLRDFVLFFVSE
jgi:hypothetical protein